MTTRQAFISSTVEGLADMRSALRHAVSRLPGWNAWAFEGAGSEPYPLDVLKREIEASDVVIAILGAAYGTVLDHIELSITEWEIRLAYQCDKELLVYKRTVDADATDHRQATLIARLDDAQIGSLNPRFITADELVEVVCRDLISIGETFDSRVVPTIDPPLVEALWDDLDIGIVGLEDLVLSARYRVALRHGRQLLDVFRQLGAPHSLERTDLERWARFLNLQYGVLAVTGHLRTGTESAIALAKEGINAAWALGDLDMEARFGIRLSGVMNMAGMSRTALEVHERYSARALDEALRSESLDTKGSILRGLGRLEEASDTLRYADLRFEGPESTRGYVKARRGGVLLCLSDRRNRHEGRDLLEEAWDLVKDEESVAQAVVIREQVAVDLRSRKTREIGIERLVHGIRLAQRLGLDQPKSRLFAIANESGLTSRDLGKMIS